MLNKIYVHYPLDQWGVFGDSTCNLAQLHCCHATVKDLASNIRNWFKEHNHSSFKIKGFELPDAQHGILVTDRKSVSPEYTVALVFQTAENKKLATKESEKETPAPVPLWQGEMEQLNLEEMATLVNKKYSFTSQSKKKTCDVELSLFAVPKVRPKDETTTDESERTTNKSHLEGKDEDKGVRVLLGTLLLTYRFKEKKPTQPRIQTSGGKKKKTKGKKKERPSSEKQEKKQGKKRRERGEPLDNGQDNKKKAKHKTKKQQTTDKKKRRQLETDKDEPGKDEPGKNEKATTEQEGEVRKKRKEKKEKTKKKEKKEKVMKKEKREKKEKTKKKETKEKKLKKKKEKKIETNGA